MATSKKVLFLLLALVLVLPTGLILSPAALAEDEQPGEGAEIIVDGPPDVRGFYTGTVSGTVIFWDGTKERLSGEFLLLIPYQDDDAVGAMWGYVGFSEIIRAKARNSQLPEKAPSQVWPPDDYNGWVGWMLLDAPLPFGKPKNKPPLTAAWFDIQDSDEGWYYVSNLTATVKLDKYRQVKSIKGTVSQSDGWVGYHANLKFTVKPYSGGLGENGLPPGFELPPGMKLPQQPK